MPASSLITPRSNAWYGLRPDLPDFRDRMFVSKPKELPASVDLRAHCCPVMNQGEIGSCAEHAVTAALRFNLLAKGLPDRNLSRLQLYYDVRVLEGTVGEDAGSELRDVVKLAGKIGVAHEELWPYDVTKFKRKPTKVVYADAVKFEALTYARVDVTPQAVKAALAAGFPVIIGLTLYPEFESDATAKTGVVAMPSGDKGPVGGHAMLCVGYDAGHFIVQNSWAADWGDKGFCYFPEGYVGNANLGSDYWTITDLKIADPKKAA